MLGFERACDLRNTVGQISPELLDVAIDDGRIKTMTAYNLGYTTRCLTDKCGVTVIIDRDRNVELDLSQCALQLRHGL